MLNAYISKKDIIDKLSELPDIDGFINKKEFQLSILSLKEKKITKQKKKCTCRINNIVDIISRTTRYINSVKYENRQSLFSLYMKGYFHISQDCVLEVFSDDGNYYLWSEAIKKKEKVIYEGQKRLDANSVVVTKKDLINILNITKPTIAKLIKLKIIIPKSEKIRIYIDGKYHEYGKCGWLNYYDLVEIRSNLISYKTVCCE